MAIDGNPGTLFTVLSSSQFTAVPSAALIFIWIFICITGFKSSMCSVIVLPSGESVTDETSTSSRPFFFGLSRDTSGEP